MKDSSLRQRLIALAESQGGEYLTRGVVSTGSVVRFRCASEHVWETTAEQALRGLWCANCARYTYSIADMRSLAKERGGKCLSLAYRGTLGRLEWECTEGHVWTATPNTIIGGSWCPRCGLGTRSIQEMKAIARKRGGVCVSDSYKNMSTALRWRCKHGHEWTAIPAHVERGSWCPSCAGHVVTIEDMRALAAEHHGECLSSEYVNTNTALRWRCAAGHVFEKPPTYVKTGAWCPECSPRQPGSLARMQAVAAERGGRCVSRKYIDTKTKLSWQCAEGHQWEAAPLHVLYSRSWCPHCAGTAQPTIQDMQRLAHERGGRCLSKQYVKSRTYLRWECRRGHVFEKTPSYVRAGGWCPQCTADLPVSIERLRVFATEHGGRCISRKFVNVKTKLTWECAKAHRWEAAPLHILYSGSWCPECAGKLKLTIDDMRQLAKQRGGRCLSDSYVKARLPLRWACQNGHVFAASAKLVRRGSWCPECRSAESPGTRISADLRPA